MEPMSPLPPPRKILLSESAEHFIDLEAAFLRRAGFEVIAVSTGQEMLDLLKGDDVDLCVVDAAMPGVAGDEIIRRARGDRSTRPPRFILVSAGGSENYERCLQSGADEIFTHPFRRQDLLKKAAALLRIPRRAHARVLVRFEVEGERLSRVPFFGSSVNLSKSGVLLESLEKMELGTELRLGFFLPGQAGRITCRGSVVRREPAEAGFTRYGVRFVDLPSDASEALERFVHRRA